MTDERIDDLEARLQAIEDLIVNLRQALGMAMTKKDYAQKKLNDIYDESNSTHN